MDLFQNPLSLHTLHQTSWRQIIYGICVKSSCVATRCQPDLLKMKEPGGKKAGMHTKHIDGYYDLVCQGHADQICQTRSQPEVSETALESIELSCEWMARRVNFHTQVADKASEKNSDYVKRLLKAVYDIMAPKGTHLLLPMPLYICV